MDYEVQALNEQVERESRFVSELQKAIQKVIVGQRYLIDRLLIGLLCDGHVLIEGVPGLAKTLSVSTLARAIDTSFQRIQFTPDLLPADILGTQVYNPGAKDIGQQDVARPHDRGKPLGDELDAGKEQDLAQHHNADTGERVPWDRATGCGPGSAGSQRT